MVTLAGAMSTAQIGRSLAPLIRAGKVQAISCTGANLEEDLFRLVADEHYQRIPEWRHLSLADETALAADGKNRVTDTYIPEIEAVRKIEDLIINSWQKGPSYPHEHVFNVLDMVEENLPRHKSWLVAAKEMGIPIFTPGWEDSTLGNIFASKCIEGLCDPSSVKSGVDQMMELAKAPNSPV